MNTPYSAQDIIAFWYQPEIQQAWFNSNPQLDAEIRERYQALWQQAKDGGLDTWQNTPDGCLALCIILDQLPLNMFRGQALSFSTEQQAVKIAKHAIQQGFDQTLLSQQKVTFLYMPLMHSEHPADQDLSVQLFTAANLTGNADFAAHHRAIVERFGRFPHRNAILGRASTAEEIAYLNSSNSFKG